MQAQVIERVLQASDGRLKKVGWMNRRTRSWIPVAASDHLIGSHKLHALVAGYDQAPDQRRVTVHGTDLHPHKAFAIRANESKRGRTPPQSLKMASKPMTGKVQCFVRRSMRRRLGE
jgi:hypothetical protein